MLIQRTVALASTIRPVGRIPLSRALQTSTKVVRPWNSHRLTGYSSEHSSKKDASDKAAASPQTTVSDTSTAPLTDKILDNSTKSTPQANTKRRRPLKPLKAAISLTPSAIKHLEELLDQPQPKFIRVGVRNRGCSGLTYHLEYVDKPGKFDEEVIQDGVKVLIDSKALFSVIGSEMDWVDDKLSSRFVFSNPNSKGSCGCGESFMV